MSWVTSLFYYFCLFIVYHWRWLSKNLINIVTTQTSNTQQQTV